MSWLLQGEVMLFTALRQRRIGLRAMPGGLVARGGSFVFSATEVKHVHSLAVRLVTRGGAPRGATAPPHSAVRATRPGAGTAGGPGRARLPAPGQLRRRSVCAGGGSGRS